MRRSRNQFVILAIVFALAGVASPLMLVASATAADGSFDRTWARTDKPVDDGADARSWIWGPTPFYCVQSEPYDSAPGGFRQVRYYDKSRMEDNAYRGSDPWDVTNGLLVVEMVDGTYQIGDAAYDESPEPASVNIVGDPGERPTYADISRLDLRTAPPAPVGSVLTATFTEDNTIGIDNSYASSGVTAAKYVPETDHSVASPFWTFMTDEATVWDDGQNVTAPLFSNPFYATGYPITEAYWSEIVVGGIQRDVLW